MNTPPPMTTTFLPSEPAISHLHGGYDQVKSGVTPFSCSRTDCDGCPHRPPVSGIRLAGGRREACVDRGGVHGRRAPCLLHLRKFLAVIRAFMAFLICCRNAQYRVELLRNLRRRATVESRKRSELPVAPHLSLVSELERTHCTQLQIDAGLHRKTHLPVWGRIRACGVMPLGTTATNAIDATATTASAPHRTTCDARPAQNCTIMSDMCPSVHTLHGLPLVPSA